MRHAFFVTTATLVLSAVLPFQVVVAQQVPDTAFTATVEKPAYTDKHPKVLFDEAHNNVHTSQGTYKAFCDLMASDGYQITANNKPFDAQTLSGYDVLIVSNARSAEGRSETPAFIEAECDAVGQWVKDGGALLFVVDHYPTGHAAERLAKCFGVGLSKGTTSDRAHAPPGQAAAGAILFSRDDKLIGDHPITRGRNDAERITRVVTFTGQSLKGPDGSTSLLILSDTAVDQFPSDAGPNAVAGSGQGRGRRRATLNGPGAAPPASSAGRSQAVAFTFGKGRVVVLGEASQLSAQRAGPQQRAMGMNFAGSDNRQWAINIMHWLSRLLD